ncbi:MAG: hypothetical protein NT169_02780 [Chloroflexi bacterium]|nr:hypothetical protein [Chloroflexota bacterium]
MSVNASKLRRIFPDGSAFRRSSFIIGPLLAYVLLSLLLTWPLATHFATHVPGDGIDDPSLAWNLWWVKHALVDQPQNPFACNWQFWPVGINLAFYTLTILNGALSVPLQAVFGIIPAYNLLLLSSFVLSGVGGYLLCREFLDGVDKATGKQVDKDVRTGQGITLSPHHLVTLSAFLGGVLYAFASAKLFYAALGQGNIASSQWAPFAALYILRAARPEGRWRDAGLAALFLTLQAYAELTYASFLLIFAALAAGWSLAIRGQGSGVRDQGSGGRGQEAGGRRRRAGGLRFAICDLRFAPFLLRLALIALLFAAGISPILANMLPDLAAEGDFFTSGGGFADVFSADLAGYLVPTQLHPILGGVIRSWANGAAPWGDNSFPVDKGQQVYLGYIATALALIGLWRGRRSKATWFWAASAALFFLLTLGPTLRIAGHDTGIPLPFALVAQLPFFKGNRYPSRYSVMLLMSMAPLVAGGVLRIAYCILRIVPPGTEHAPRTTLPLVCLSTCLLAALLIFEHLSIPLPLFALSVPKLYEKVAAEAGDFAVLELPLGWRNGARVVGKQDILIMQQLWYQTAHGKRLLGGNTSRNPEFKFQYFSEDPTLARLIALTNAADLPQHGALRAALAAAPVTETEQAAARKWAAFLDIRYVMVHRDKLPAETETTLRALLPVTLVGEEGSLALYRVASDLPMPQAFAVGTDAGRMALAEGWSPPGINVPIPDTHYLPEVYAQRREARLLLPLGQGTSQLRLHARALAPGQTVMLVADGRTLASQPLPEEAIWLAFDIPADETRSSLSDVRLHFSTLTQVPQLGGGPWPIGQTGATSPVSILARSAGQETGDFAHVYVNGVDVSPNQRGYNLAAFAPGDGKLLATAAFDTHGDAGAGARLATWVRDLPVDAIVAGVARDEASMNLGGEAVQALQSLGVSFDLRGHFRWGHAFVGKVGAAPGAAAEAWNGSRPAQVSVGWPVSGPQVAAALLGAVIVK